MKRFIPALWLSLSLVSCKDMKSEGFVSDNNEVEVINTTFSRLFNLGLWVDDNGQFNIYLGGTDAEGNALSATDLADATITVEKNGETLEIPSSEWTLTALEDLSGVIQSQTITLDLEKSVSIEDIELERKTARTYIGKLAGSTEFRTYAYSHYVEQASDYSSNRRVAEDGVGVLHVPLTDGLALYDAFELSLTGALAGQGPMRSSLIFASNRDTRSFIFDKADVKSFAETTKIFTLAIGSRDANVDELKELAGANGAVIYSEKLEDIADSVEKVADIFLKGVKIDLGPNSLAAQKIKVKLSETQTTEY